MKYFMGIDTGTQGVRIGIIDENGEVIKATERSWKTSFPGPGEAEQDPLSWWENIELALIDLFKDLDKNVKDNIVSACVDSTSSTVLAVSEDGKPLMPAIMWMDVRAKEETDIINDTKDKVLDYSGGAVSAEWYVPKVLWIKRHKKDIYDKAYLIIEQLDYINYKFTGMWTSSLCNTVCKGNYVPSLGGYNKDYFTKIGLPDWDDKVTKHIKPVAIGTPIGKIKPELADKYNLSHDIIFVEGGIDAHIGMFGTNAIKEGKLSVIMGTSFVHLGLVNHKPDIEGIWGPYEDAIIKGTWCVEGGQASAAGLDRWFIDTFNIDKNNPYIELKKAIEETPLGADGLIALDFFQGNRTPYKDSYARGAIFGLTMQHTWKHIYRSILEAISFGTHNIISNFDNQGYHIDEIVASGGVTKNDLFLQLISDITGKTIVINRDSQAGVLGCAVIACGYSLYNGDFQKACDKMVKELRRVLPDMKKHELYKPVFEKYKKLYLNTRELNKG